MKFMLGEKDYLEKHHIYSLIVQYRRENEGHNPEYVIVHPATYHKIVMATNERNDDFLYTVMAFNHRSEKPFVTIYGLAFIRSEDVEPDFIIIT